MRWLLLSFLLLALSAGAHDTIVVRNARMLTIEDGLSQGYIFSTHQDRNGLVWLCTKDGLNRFDGKEVVTYSHDPSDPHSLARNGVTSVFEDREGRMWVTFFGSGLDLYSKERNGFVHAGELFPGCALGQDASVKWITQDDAGRYWCQTERGLFRFEWAEVKGTGERKWTPKVTCTQIIGTGNPLYERGNDSHFFRDHRGKPFITVRHQVYAVDFNSAEVYAQEILSGVFRPADERFAFVSLVHGKDTSYFIYRSQGWQYGSDPAKGKAMQLPFVYISSIQGQVVGPQGQLLGLDVNTNLTAYDPASGATSVYRFELPDGKLLIPYSVSTLLIDRSKNLWLGSTGYGALLFQPLRESFRYAHPGKGRSASFYAMRMDTQGDLLVAAHRVVYRFRPEAGRFTGLLSGRPLQDIPRDTLFARDFIPDGKGGYYALRGNELWQIRGSSYRSLFRAEAGVRFSELFPIQPDERGDLWMCSHDSVYRWSVQSEKITFRDTLPIRTNPGYVPSVTHCILPDGDLLWMGTVDGLLRLDPKTRLWKVWRFAEGSNRAPSAEQVFWIHQDERDSDILWLGTYGGGLNRFSKSRETFEHFTMRDGLPNNVVYAVLQDSRGMLWLSTNRGIARFNPTSREVVQYTAESGLQSNEFNRYAAFEDASGIMYFGGVNGLNWFNPLAMAQDEGIPPVLLTDVQGASGVLRDEHDQAVDPITVEHIELAYNQNFLRLHFAAIDFISPERIHYRYRMASVDSSWVNLGTSREIILAGLPPGTHTIELQATNASGSLHSPSRILTVFVRAAWYASWWFRLLIVGAAAGVIVLLYRMRLRRFVELQRVRDHIARDLHDEIGSSLSSISIYSKIVMENSDRPVRELVPVLQRVRDISQRMMESMSDIVWAINSQHDDWSQLIQRMRATATELTEAGNITLLWEADAIPERFPLGMEKRRNLYLLFKEAINNSVKYSGNTELSVSLKRAGDTLVLTITDKGKGFDPELTRSGNGLVNMRERARLIGGQLTVQSAPGQGTTIILHFR